MRLALLALLSIGCFGGCGDNKLTADGSIDSHELEDTGVDAPDPNNPATLFDTGLCVDRACTQISPDVHEYTPQWALWADTASKHRWYYLPPGTQIDTSDMDHWQFPVGTKFWKEFSRDGVRVETRLVMRIGAGDTTADWFYVPYQWNATNDDTTAVPMGVQNANGTQHDIPSRLFCKMCHEGLKPSRILGFGALQLDAPAVNAGETTLASLVAANTLTVNPPAPTSGSTFYPIDGNKDALGYIHANCSHCHNPTSGTHDIVPMELRMLVGEVHDHTLTAAYRTAVGKRATIPLGTPKHCPDTNNVPNAAECIITPGNPTDSDMFVRFTADPASNLHMPAAGSEMTDPTGMTTLSTWITTP
jgi:hypothetical protein